MLAFLRFRKMITPALIEVLFWALTGLSCIVGLRALVQGNFAHGLKLILLEPLLIRVGCEIVIVTFRNHDHLTFLRQNQAHAKDHA